MNHFGAMTLWSSSSAFSSYRCYSLWGNIILSILITWLVGGLYKATRRPASIPLLHKAFKVGQEFAALLLYHRTSKQHGWCSSGKHDGVQLHMHKHKMSKHIEAQTQNAKAKNHEHKTHKHKMHKHKMSKQIEAKTQNAQTQREAQTHIGIKREREMEKSLGLSNPCSHLNCWEKNCADVVKYCHFLSSSYLYSDY